MYYKWYTVQNKRNKKTVYENSKNFLVFFHVNPAIELLTERKPSSYFISYFNRSPDISFTPLRIP